MMTKEKYENIGESLRATCVAEEKRPNGGHCGFIFLLAEAEAGAPKQIRLRTLTGMPRALAIQVLEMALFNMRTPDPLPPDSNADPSAPETRQ